MRNGQNKSSDPQILSVQIHLQAPQLEPISPFNYTRPFPCVFVRKRHIPSYLYLL